MKSKVVKAFLVFVLILISLACGIAGGQGMPQSNQQYDPPFQQATLEIIYVDCQPTNQAIADLGNIFYEGALALTDGNNSGYESALAKARQYPIPQHKFAMAYKNTVITGMQLAQMVVNDPTNTNLQTEYNNSLKNMDEKATEWRNLSCGSGYGQSNNGEPDNSQQPAQPNTNQDTQPNPSNQGSGSYECDPSRVDAFWYDKLVPAHSGAERIIANSPDTSSFGNLDNSTSNDEAQLWSNSVDKSIADYQSLSIEAASICEPMKSMYEMWEDSLSCIRTTFTDMYIYNNYDTMRICKPVEIRHSEVDPNGIPLVYLRLMEASGLDLYMDGVRR